MTQVDRPLRALRTSIGDSTQTQAPVLTAVTGSATRSNILHSTDSGYSAQYAAWSSSTETDVDGLDRSCASLHGILQQC